MRRLLLLLVFAGVMLGMTGSASAGWFHFGRPFRHFHHFRHHVHRWVHRPHFHRHYVHRHYVHRHYYVAPRFYSYGFCFPWHQVIRFHVPVIRHYRVYYSTPFCATTPASPATTTWSYAQSRDRASARGLETQVASRQPARAVDIVRPKVVDFDAERSSTASGKLASFRTELPRAAIDTSPSGVRPSAEDQLVDLGERLFRGQFYGEALSKFDSASGRAPAAASLHVRRGHALVALGRYDQAALAFRRALVLDPEFAQSDWRLARLYGSQNRAVLDKHVESLAGAALQAAGEPDLYFLIGVYLHFDGQHDRAQKFFRQAAELESPGAAHLRPFLHQEAPRETRDKLASAATPTTVAQPVSLRR